MILRELLGKIAFGNANARDMLALKASVSKLPELKKVLSSANSVLLKEIYESMDVLEDIYKLIESAIIEEPGITITER